VLLAEETVGSVLDLVTTLAAETLPGSSGAGVTLLDGSTRTSAAATDPLVEEADALQYELDEGPCLSAARDQVTYRIDSMWNETRWPHWTVTVAHLGLGSSLSSPLVVRGDSFGAVEVYARPEEAFTDRDERILALFADKASVILANARSQEELRRLNGHLREALRTRDAIAQAKGVLRERHHIDERKAFGMLVERSQRTNRKVRDIAQEILASTGSSAPDPASG
jgi:GAF domain-containing protein